MTGKSLRIIRIVIQVAVMLLLTGLLLAAPTAAVVAWRDGLRSWMLLPLALAGMLLTAAVWTAVTLTLGRVYCSTFCPVGTLQDLAGAIARLLRRGRRGAPRRYREPAPPYIRAGMVAILIMSIGLGAAATQWALLPFIQVSPVDSYGLILDTVVTATGSDTGLPRIGWRLMVAAAVDLVFIAAMGIMLGRVLCNRLCPLGGALGAMNTVALFQIDIDTDTCTRCRRCEDVCKAYCIDTTAGTVDTARCVNCFDCLAVCPDRAIRYTTRRHRLSIPMLQSVKPPKPALTDSSNKINN